MTFRVAFGADDDNECVAAVLHYLEGNTQLVRNQSRDAWPEFAKSVGESVTEGYADFGVLMCWTGTGTAIAANKVRGVRAAQAWEPWIAEAARKWNDANVLTLSLKRTAPEVAVECVAAFLNPDLTIDPDELDNIAHIELP